MTTCSFVSRLLSRLRRRVGRLSGELPGVLPSQSLPGAEVHRITTSNAADGSSVEKAIQNIETNMPPGGAPRDEAAVDVVPEGEARAAARGFEFPPDIAVLKQFGSVGSGHFCFYASFPFPPR